MLDLDQARADLEAKTPEVWTRVYAMELIRELEAHRKKTGDLAAKLLIQSRNVGAAIQALAAIKRHLDAFSRATGWTPEGRGKKLGATGERWTVSQAFASRVTVAARGFFDAIGRPLGDPAGKVVEPNQPDPEIAADPVNSDPEVN